jgi:hypothetical protein
LRIRKSRRPIGAWLADNVTRGGERWIDVDGDDIKGRLPDWISRDQSSRWQKLAATPTKLPAVT